jgi:hypothetical protein
MSASMYWETVEVQAYFPGDTGRRRTEGYARAKLYDSPANLDRELKEPRLESRGQANVICRSKSKRKVRVRSKRVESMRKCETSNTFSRRIESIHLGASLVSRGKPASLNASSSISHHCSQPQKVKKLKTHKRGESAGHPTRRLKNRTHTPWFRPWYRQGPHQGVARRHHCDNNDRNHGMELIRMNSS